MNDIGKLIAPLLYIARYAIPYWPLGEKGYKKLAGYSKVVVMIIVICLIMRDMPYIRHFFLVVRWIFTPLYVYYVYKGITLPDLNKVNPVDQKQESGNDASLS